MSLDKNKIKRYIRLDQLLRDPEGHTLEEILCDEQMDMISERTLRMNLNEFSEHFGAEWDFSLPTRGHNERLWRYKDISFSIFKQINRDVEIIKNAIENLNSFKGDPRYDWFRFYLMGLEKGIQSSVDFMSFYTNSEYSGLEHIEPLANAIIHEYPIKLTYEPFNKGKIQTNFHPYHIRQYNGRWFVFGYSEERLQIQNFALDRITNIEHLRKPYKPTDIKFDEYFDEIVGVTNYKDNPVETIILKVDKESFDYIRTKPLHWSQTIIKKSETDDHIIIRLRVKVNTELMMLIYSYNEAIEVIKPAFLRDEIRVKMEKMYYRYKA